MRLGDVRTRGFRRALGAATLLVLAFACRRDAAASSKLERLRSWGADHQAQLVHRLARLVELPSVGRNPAGLSLAADELQSQLEAVGMKVENIAKEGPALLLATGGSPNAKRTLLLYAHYDGQNVVSQRKGEDWRRCAPFEPELLEAQGERWRAVDIPEAGSVDGDLRLCGRASADDKGPIAVVLQVLEGVKALELEPLPVRVKLLLDGAEESGSYNLEAALSDPDNRARLETDVVISLDGPLFATGQPTMVFGVRGILTFDLTTYGAYGDLHSGHYGNWAPNPVAELAHVISTMKDPYSGAVLVKDFDACRVELGPKDQASLAAVPDLDDQVRREHGLSRTETQWSLKEAVTHPSLNIRGIAGGSVGDEARTVVPARAEAAIDIRLVKGCGTAEMADTFTRHLASLGYTVLDHDPSSRERATHAKIIRLDRRAGGYAAVRTATDDALANELADQIEAATGQPPVRIPTMGGSLPLHAFEAHLGAPIIGIPLVNHDNNQHGPDENVRVGSLFRGFDVISALLTSTPKL